MRGRSDRLLCLQCNPCAWRVIVESSSPRLDRLCLFPRSAARLAEAQSTLESALARRSATAAATEARLAESSAQCAALGALLSESRDHAALLDRALADATAAAAAAQAEVARTERALALQQARADMATEDAAAARAALAERMLAMSEREAEWAARVERLQEENVRAHCPINTPRPSELMKEERGAGEGGSLLARFGMCDTPRLSQRWPDSPHWLRRMSCYNSTNLRMPSRPHGKLPLVSSRSNTPHCLDAFVPFVYFRDLVC